MNLTDSITTLKGVGDKTKKIFEKMGIWTIGDLLEYYPRDYKTFEAPVSIENMMDDEEHAYLIMIQESPQMIKKGYKVIISLKIMTQTKGSVFVYWYGAPYIRQQLQVGHRIILYGKITVKGKKRIMEHPEILTIEQYHQLQQTMQPIYRLTEGMTQKMMTKYIQQAINLCLEQTDDLPAELRKQYQLAEYNFAMRQIHFPERRENLQIARRRIVFEEFFLFISALKRVKRETNMTSNHYILDCKEQKTFFDHLPFKLTNAQLKVCQDISLDVKKDTVMNRLIQGDVGSGKTMVAAYAMFLAARNGYQSCMMAPTEVLAKQHYENLCPLFEKMSIRVTLLTGSMTATQKKKVYDLIAKHEVDIVIGTQALFQEKAKYAKLALIITDEQHRFGVRQREALALKSQAGEPHILVMSATPIPRTLALILYSDMNVSIIDEKPANRLPIKNCVVGQSYRKTACQFMNKQIQEGRQVYVICPMVEDSEHIEAENVLEYTQMLKGMMPDSIRIRCLHGKMKALEKNEIMTDFSNGMIDILVATTVVEVGVDVPNATVMMIENAERFGLAQLHQLRGRVGRGKNQSYCIFMYGKESQKIKERLDIMVKTNDGYLIAEKDLELRGPGELFGDIQSGELVFKLGDVFNDSELLKLAATAADAFDLSKMALEQREYCVLNEKINRFILKGKGQITL